MRAKIRLAIMSVVVAAFAAAALAPQAANARSEYKDGFAKLYDGKLAKVDCNVCHDAKNPKNKRLRNEYGQAFGKALNAKKCEDEAKIEAALKKAAAEKGKAGKTYGELIEAGKRPAG